MFCLCRHCWILILAEIHYWLIRCLLILQTLSNAVYGKHYCLSRWLILQTLLNVGSLSKTLLIVQMMHYFVSEDIIESSSAEIRYWLFWWCSLLFVQTLLNFGSCSNTLLIVQMMHYFVSEDIIECCSAEIHNWNIRLLMSGRKHK